jgi:RND family efflux transporter MFP subunit
MKRIVLFIISIVIVASCAKSKKDQVSDLMKQKSEISAKIKTLQAELKSESKQEAKVAYVTAQTVNPGLFNHFVEIQGDVSSDNNIYIPAESNGLVKRIFVTEGDKVVEGQILAKLDDIMIKRQINQVKTNLTLAKVVFEKQERLWNKNIGREIDYLQAKTNKESLESQLEILNEQVAKTEIHSPIDGTIDNVDLKVGEMAAAGMKAIRVVKISDLKIKAQISEQYVKDVNLGDKVEVKIPTIDEKFTTNIIAKSKIINPNNRTFSIEIDVPKHLKTVKPNMLAVLTINDYKNENAIAVPINSVINSLGTKYVFVAKKENGKLIAVQQDVKVGKYYNSKIEIVEGINPNDQIITFGYQNLSDKQEIAINELK